MRWRPLSLGLFGYGFLATPRMERRAMNNLRDERKRKGVLGAPLQALVLSIMVILGLGTGEALAASPSAAGGSIAVPDPGPPASDPVAVVTAWTDIAGREVVLRGQGLEKVNGHNLTIETVRAVTQLVERVPSGGSAYKYETVAEEVTCNTGLLPGCEVTNSQLIRVVVEEFMFSDGKPQGVITAYCPGAGQLCPGWVNTAING
jgi:hypothetical protein